MSPKRFLLFSATMIVIIINMLQSYTCQVGSWKLNRGDTAVEYSSLLPVAINPDTMLGSSSDDDDDAMEDVTQGVIEAQRANLMLSYSPMTSIEGR